VEFGVCAGGAAGVVPGCWGIVLGVCGAVLGVEVCEPAVDPFWSEPVGEVLFGVVWAATQIAESSSKENSMLFDFMTVSRLRCVSFCMTVGVSDGEGNPVESLGRWRRYRTAELLRHGMDCK